MTRRTYVVYRYSDRRSVRSAMFDPELLPPATPAFDSMQEFLIVQLPILAVRNHSQPTTRNTGDLLERLSTAPEEWAIPLWHRIRPLQPLDELLTRFHQRKPFIISSDASVDAAKHSCCAWSIYGATTLWKGEGVIPGNCDDTYSGRSEAFGVLTALQFLQHYLRHYPQTRTMHKVPLTVYCDNSGTITQAKKYTSMSETFPNQTITDDYDIYKEIAEVVSNLTQFSTTFVHIKGHQNGTKSNRLLTLPAQMNIECDERATRFISHARRTRQCDNPALPQAYPHIQIHGKTIVREYAKALRHAAQTPDYQDYVKDKFQWTDQDCDDINWVSLKYALRKLTPADTTRIQKFIHEWLPMKGAKHTASPTNSPLCPQCKREAETTWHFFECLHNDRAQRFRNLQADLNALHRQSNVDPHLFQLLWQGLLTIRTDTPIDDQYNTYPDLIKPLFQSQANIGWEQLYYGCISTLWAQHLTASSNYKINGNVFYAQVTGVIWKYIFDCWTQRNQHLHSPETEPPDYIVLADQVRQIIETSHNDPALATMAPTHTAEQILKRPLPMIRSWAQRGAQHMHNYLTAAHKRAVLHTKDIRNYFKVKQNPDLRPP